MNQTKFEDRCSKCGQQVLRLRRNLGPEMRLSVPYLYNQGATWTTSCCSAPPLAVPVVKET